MQLGCRMVTRVRALVRTKLGRVGARKSRASLTLTTNSVAETGAVHRLKTKSASLHNLSHPPADAESSLSALRCAARGKTVKRSTTCACRMS